MPCTSTVSTIEQFCGEVNAPMLDRKLYIAPGSRITTIPAPGAGTHIISTDLTMATAEVFSEWFFSKDESSYSSERDENGMWNTEVVIFVEKMAGAKTYIFNGSLGDNNVAIVVDKNGNERLIGDLTNGCSIGVRETTTPKNGYEVRITWQSSHAPYYYTGSITT